MKERNPQRWRFACLIAATLLVLFITAPPTWAQSDTGSLNGTVSDITHSVIPGATVTLKETNAGTAYSAKTTKAGNYLFAAVRPGHYTLTVKAAGFRTYVRQGLRIFIGSSVTQNVELHPGAVTQTVTVSGAAPELDTSTSSIATVISQRQVEQLPLAVGGSLRSLQALEFLVPGAVGPGTAGGTTYAKLNGGQDEGSDYLLDGISTQRSENGSSSFDQTTPSVEAVQEFRVDITGMPAEYGDTTGGIANFKTRGGTNQYHGVMYDFYKNAVFDANNWFSNGRIAEDAGNPAAQAQFKRPPDTKNDYGITLGGPVWIPHVYNGHNKTFFFFSFEQLRYSNGGTAISTVPTKAERAGDFSATLGGPLAGDPINPCTGNVIRSGEIYDPSTTQTVPVPGGSVQCRSPFPNNQVPVGRSQIAQKVLSYVPLPNLPGLQNNFGYYTTSQNTQTVWSLRIDQNIGAKSHLFGFYNARENLTPGNYNFPFPIETGPQVQDFYAKYFRGGWDYSITPHLTNEFNIGSNRINSFNSSRAALSGKDWDKMLGITNGFGPTFPNFNTAPDGMNIGQANADDNVNTAISANDQLVWQLGKQNITMGGTYWWQQFSYINNGGESGAFNFSRNQTAAVNDLESQTGNAFASFLLGAPLSETRQIFFHHPRWIQHYYALFVQDNWKFNKNLTLNLGLRWSVETPRWEAEGDSSALNPTAPNPGANGRPGVLEFAGVGPGRDGVKHQTWANIYHKDFSPRVGFAWAPGWLDHKTVWRGNYSIIYGPLIYADYGQGLTQGWTANPNYHNPDPYLPYGNLDAGFPTPPSGVDLNPNQLNGQGIDYVAKSYGRPAMVQSWSLQVQQQLPSNFVFSLAYLGMHSTRLHALLNYPNDMPEKYLTLGNKLLEPLSTSGIAAPFANFSKIWGSKVQSQQALRPFPQYGYINTDSYLQNTGQASYNALTAKLQHRFSHGLTLLVSYTFSKDITDADSIQPFYSTLLSQGGTQNPFDQKAEKCVSNQDVPNNLVISYLYNLPVGRGHQFLGHTNPIISRVVSGWRLGGILRYVSAQPVSFFGAEGIPGFDNGIRFNHVPGQSFLSARARAGRFDPFDVTGPCNGTGYFNCAAFQDPNANRNGGTWHFGTMPRNSASVRPFPYADEDMNLNKSFHVHGNISMDLRLAAFNVFNRHVFAKPVSNPYAPDFGQILNQFNTGQLVLGPRTMQVVLKIHY